MRTFENIFWAAAIAAIAVSCGKGTDDIARKTNDVRDGANGLYPFSIAAGNGSATRATLNNDGYEYTWEADDNTGLIITRAGLYAPIGSVIKMSNDSGAGEHATFTGKLTQAQLDEMSFQDTYDYYSFFPYEIGSAGALPEVLFSIPSTLSVKQNVFNSDYAPMAAEIKTGEAPALFVEGQKPTHGELLHFGYKHTMAYAAIEMDVRLMPEGVKSIKMTNTSGTPICGTYKYNMLTGTGGYSSGGNEITINIVDEGLTAGGGNVVYIPMPVADMTGQTFTLAFTSGSSSNKFENVATVTGVNFEKGKIHKLKVAPAATYTKTTSFTTTKAGHYYVEAWGGNGGDSNCGSRGYATGGSGGVKRGLFYIAADTTLEVVVGEAGADAAGRRANAQGGASGIGSGGQGARGGSEVMSGNDGYAGAGGGGGASGIKISGTVRLAAGGGSGGAGTADHSDNIAPYSGVAGSDVDRSQNPSGGNGNSTNVPSGGIGNDGQSGSVIFPAYYYGGGGGSGGGGGYPRGGFGGGGGERYGNTINNDPRGGAGGGGMNYTLNTESTSGYTLPSHSWTGKDGYVVITFIR